MRKIGLCLLCTLILLLSCACTGDESQQPLSDGASNAPTDTITATTTATTITTTTTTVPASTTTKRVADTTTKKTTPTTNGTSLPLWKQIYLFTIQKEADKYDSFALVDLDGDDIPEMFKRGKDGHVMSAWRKVIGSENYSITNQPLNNNNGAYYIPKSGRFMNVYVDGDRMTMKIYELTDSRFVELFTGYEYTYEGQEKVYYFADQTDPVTPAEYNAKVDSLFKRSKAASLETPALSTEEFQEQVKKW